MNGSDVYLICFGIGSLWSVASLLMGGMRLGHGSHGHSHAGHGHGAHGHSHGAHGHSHTPSLWGSWVSTLLTPGCIAVFLAWFGGIGYILTRHSALGRWADLAIACLVGFVGAFLLGAFLRWLMSQEKPLEAMDTEMVGQLGHVSSAIRADGVGEMIFIRDGSRRAVPVRSEDGSEISREEEVVITRYEKGIAFVRTWEALTQPDTDSEQPGRLATRRLNNVE